MIINAVTKIENKKLLIKHFIDLETGEIYENIARLFDAIPKKNTNIYINVKNIILIGNMEFKNRNTAFLFLIFIRLLIKCEKLKIILKN